MKPIPKFLAVVAFLFTPVVHAAGFTPFAVPTRVEMVTGGALISGSFGDPNSCSVANYIFVARENVSFKEIMSMAITAIAAGRPMRFYSDTCVPVTAYWLGNVINKSADSLAALQ